MANSEDPDEMAHYMPFHLDLHCLQRYQYWSAGLKGLWLRMLGKNFSRRHFGILVLFLPENKVNLSCKSSPLECQMNVKAYLLGQLRKSIINLASAIFV